MYDGNNPTKTSRLWMLRTPDLRVDLSHLIHTAHIRNDSGKLYFRTTQYEANFKCYVRPVFYLNSEFFDNANIEFIGENVLEKIK